jgi:hypothetical protein
MLSWYFALPHVGTRVLCSSLLFLNRRTNPKISVSRRITFRGVWEPLLVLISGVFRLVDGHLQTRLSVYGWALYFGLVGGTRGPNSPSKCLRPLRHGPSCRVVDPSWRSPETLDFLQSLSLPGLWRDEPLQSSCAL